MLDEYEKSIARVKFFLKLIGLSPDTRDDQRNMWHRLRHHPIYVLFMILFNLTVIGKIQWLRDAFMTGKKFLDITYCFPCFTLCLLSDFITLSTLIYAQHVNDLIDRLNVLQLELLPTNLERDTLINVLIGENTSKLKSITEKYLYLIGIGLFVFGMRPLLAMYSHYSNTGEILYLSPLYVSYPFDKNDMKFYPFVYIHQLWTGTQALFCVYGPSCLFFTCCTFIHIQFFLLQFDIERVIDKDYYNTDSLTRNYNTDSFKINIKKLIARHEELLRCVELLEIINSKSILFNAFTSSMMICVTGFNIMANENVMTMAFFTSFLMLSLLQIFFFCYYGDNIMQSSGQVSDAIYNSPWYNIDPQERKTLLMILIRAQRPCRITAYGFFDINLRAFTSILSKSWSYFAVLKTMYHPE